MPKSFCQIYVHFNKGEVEKYISNQMKHHEKMSFKDEFRAYLKKDKIENDCLTNL